MGSWKTFRLVYAVQNLIPCSRWILLQIPVFKWAVAIKIYHRDACQISQKLHLCSAISLERRQDPLVMIQSNCGALSFPKAPCNNHTVYLKASSEEIQITGKNKNLLYWWASSKSCTDFGWGDFRLRWTLCQAWSCYLKVWLYFCQVSFGCLLLFLSVSVNATSVLRSYITTLASFLSNIVASSKSSQKLLVAHHTWIVCHLVTISYVNRK